MALPGSNVSGPSKRAMIKTGTYTGDGLDDRDIDIGVNLASKENVWVMIKGENNQIAIHRIEYGQGDLGMYFNNLVDAADTIQGFTATGFQIGQGGVVNGNGTVFRYIVMWEGP